MLAQSNHNNLLFLVFQKKKVKYIIVIIKSNFEHFGGITENRGKNFKISQVPSTKMEAK